ncbi:hypothetical protein ACFFL1_11785 [Samsonia erythrinae]|uniref:Uncharacterized protein n=1 Tax=Samsonia erythrinae TaxID=160434 RepID=A0A4R3VMG2_9GAMM|nr:hypothetical protein [Samsonia erythrinae]TCV05101.1 hypothetical protein EDC54_10787 [Samsonia erythrinae]
MMRLPGMPRTVVALGISILKRSLTFGFATGHHVPDNTSAQ